MLLPRTPLSSSPESGLRETGTWRIYRPSIDPKRCNRCLLCLVHCPEGSIKFRKEGPPEIDLRYCKGCGICAQVCPSKAIFMKFEGEVRNAPKDRNNR
ncbi:MAG TPA: 4Fe-4S binding protein [Candidatus Bathyarchaeia archaeon]|nr:4Fe-4S binding protein [Candidatus Bathyarchaeia archaeon]